MAIDWSLAPKISGSDYLGPLHAMELGRQATAQRLQEQARTKALQQQTDGNTAGAQQTAVSAGDFDLASHLAQASDQHRQQLAAVYSAAAQAAYGLKGMPPEQRQAAFDAQAPHLQALGVPPDILANQRAHLDDASLDAVATQSMSIVDQIKRHDEMNKPVVLADGAQLTNPQTGAVVGANAPDPKWVPLPAGGSLAQVGPNGITYSTPGGGAPMAPGANPGPMSSQQLLPAVIAQESGGVPRPGVPTQYGTAQGVGQMLPKTAEGTARALGIPYDPVLAKGTSPEAIAYQSKLAQSYLDQGLQKYGGDPRKALMFYHGGPDESLWGKKTRAYADQVMGRLGQNAGPQPNIINGPPKVKDAPSGYQYTADGKTLQPIPGGPADTGNNPKTTLSTEVAYRKEFDQLPEVKTFKIARQQFQALKALATKPNPTGQDDIALIFTYMKTLDPTSTVREGEFATAQNSGSLPQNIFNAYNKALQGTRLSPVQRKGFVSAAGENYLALRQQYNQAAENYRGYARDIGVNPDHVARTYTPDPGTRGSNVPARGPVKVSSPAEAMKLAPGTIYIGGDGVTRRR